MELRFIDAKDYEIVKGWWEDWGFPVVSQDYLTDFGFIVSNEGVDTYAGWLYPTGTKIALVEFIVSNKKADKKLKVGGMERLIDGISVFAETLGIDTLFHTTNEPKMMKHLKRCNFKETDKNVTNFIKSI